MAELASSRNFPARIKSKNTMKKKLFIFIYTSAIVLGVVVLNIVVTTIKESSSASSNAVEQADIALSQYTERPNSVWSTEHASRFQFLFDYFFTRTQAVEKGCSLGFS